MIDKAKANASAVKAFEQSASAVKDYSFRLDKGVQCLEMLLDVITKAEKALDDAISKTTQVISRLSDTIDEIMQKIARLTARLEQLNSRMESLETKLEHTQENGDYPGEEAVSAKISATESEIDSIVSELSSLEERLNDVNEVYGRLESHADAMKGVAYSLAGKENVCLHLRDELETIRQKNLCQGTSATETLKKLQDIISKYLRIKMKYEDMPLMLLGNEKGRGSSTNINVNIHKSSFVQMQSVRDEVKISQKPVKTQEEQEVVKPLISEREIKKHKISFDASGRIVLYDGKTFGGIYNSYETRWGFTSVDDNPMLGYYEGERGESKFIPSKRTAEGIIITEILKQYGLDGIVYRNAEPDFEACAEAVVKITAMTENRENYLNDDGILVWGNFSQADMQLAEEWNRVKREGRKDWKARDVFDYRKENRLTWHEKCDTKTMVLVRVEINLFFKHSGGVSECRARDSVTDNGGGFDE